MNTVRISWGLSPTRLFIIIQLVSVCVGISSACSGLMDGNLIVAQSSVIYKYDPDFTNRVMLARSPLPISFEYDLQRDILYWTDLNTRQVKTIEPATLQSSIIIDKQNDWMPNSIALDPFNQKLYVLDSFSGTVNIFDLRTNKHGVVIGVNVVDAVRIDIDPYAQYLFILDKYEIFRTDLDGNNRVTIYGELQNERQPHNAYITKRQSYGIPISITDFTVDVEGKRVYWVSSQSRRVESSDYQGGNRRLHYHKDDEQVGFQTHTSLAFLYNKLYWADNLNKNTIVIDLNERTSRVFAKNLLTVKGVSCKDELPVPRSPCMVNNGGCQNLCVSSRNSYGFRCACNIGYKLNADKRSCARVEDFLLFTLSNYIRGLVTDFKETTFIDALNPSNFQVGSGSRLDFDAKDREIYYTSLYPKDQLHRIDMDSKQDIVMLPDLLSKNVGKFAYDWVTKNLYYFTYYYSDMTTLSVMNTESISYSKILLDDVVDFVRDIVVHPNRGYLFFSHTGTNNDMVSRMALDGSDLRVIVQVDSPNCLDGLEIDFTTDRLYWIDNCKAIYESGQIHIHHANLDGSDIREMLVPQQLRQLDDLAIGENEVFAVTGANDAIIRLNKNGPLRDFDRLDVAPVGGISSLKIFGRRSQRIEPGNPCAPGHMCEKFCLTYPKMNGSLVSRCACPYGEKLAHDSRTCIDNHWQEPPFIPCDVPTYKCKRRTQNTHSV